MNYQLRGYNFFYQGWLAFILRQPDDATQDENWRAGWRMASESGWDVGTVLPLEIEKGHIIVEIKQS